MLLSIRRRENGMPGLLALGNNRADAGVVLQHCNHFYFILKALDTFLARLLVIQYQYRFHILCCSHGGTEGQMLTRDMYGSNMGV